MNKQLTFIDLFAGMGGFRIAFESNNAKCVFSSEIDKWACKTYFDNFNEFPYGDITKISANDIPNFDILCAGFPCQPFSIGGHRLGFEDTRGTLFFDVARILNEKKPKAFLLENVKGITNHDNGKTLKVIENSLLELGYTIKHKVLNAKDYGIPQNRERWYCIGFRKDILNESNQIVFPEKCDLKYDLSNIIKNNVDISYKISEICKQNIEKHINEKKILITEFTLANEVRPSRCQFSKGLWAPCLTAKMGTGGNNIPIVVKQNRKLTEEECLKIMGYPDMYKVSKGYQTYKQIGNSVVVPILTKLATEIVNKLKGNI
ncbi:MAG: DNA (cytosine-5-)-methyltransferase [Spirochaetaceae bacterium]|nr:DNA (cytosine-5-)-methyltransferase [Spirochaetaceae bacterium]